MGSLNMLSVSFILENVSYEIDVIQLNLHILESLE